MIKHHRQETQSYTGTGRGIAQSEPSQKRSPTYQALTITLDINFLISKAMLLSKTGEMKLFSRSAQSQCSRYQGRARPSTAAPRSSTPSTPKSQHSVRKKIINGFDMVESREQREKKFRPVETPPVGKYNLYRQQKPKLTFDFLKIYNSRTQPRSAHNTVVKTQMTQNVEEIEDGDILRAEEPGIVQPSIEHSLNLPSKTQVLTTGHRFNKNKQRRTHDSSLRGALMRTQVDMSRMTGRQPLKQPHTQQQSFSHDSMNMSRSIDFLKSKTTKRIDFKHQLSRQKINTLNKTMTMPSDYSYDYLKIRPKISTTVDFGRLVGRDDGKQSLNLSYTSYDFNKYVWEGKSNIYPNTKTSVIDLKKQSMKRAFHRLA